MEKYTLLPAGSGGDFALRVLDDSLLPYVKAGEVVRLRRSVELRDGDVGLFRSREGMVFRQFCQDSQGNVYLFPVNRRYQEKSVMIPRRRVRRLVCYGRLILSRRIPLPMD